MVLSWPRSSGANSTLMSWLEKVGLSVYVDSSFSPGSPCAALWNVQPFLLQFLDAQLTAVGEGQGKIHVLLVSETAI